MPSKGMKKLRQIEKVGLIGLCVVMLGTLGIGTSTVVKGCGQEQVFGSFVIQGEEIEVAGPTYREYRAFLTFQNGMMRRPPRWKFAFPSMFGGRQDPQFADYEADQKDLWTFIILDHAAMKMGVTIPPRSIQEWIKQNFRDPRTGLYSRETYQSFLRNPGVLDLWPTAAAFEKFLTRYLTVEYLIDCYNPLLWPTMDQVYDRWKFQNKRHDFEYVVQSISAIRREIDPSAFTGEEIKAHYDLDSVQRNFRIPTRRSFEAVYCVLDEVTDEQMTKLREIAEKENLVTIGPNEGFEHYYGNIRLYPTGPIVEKLREAHEEKKEKEKPAEKPKDEPKDEPKEEPKKEDPAREDTDKQGTTDEPEEPEAPAEEEKPAETEEPSEEENTAGPGLDVIPGVTYQDDFVDPTLGMTPQEKYAAYFKEKVEKELFLKRLLERILKDERTDEEGMKAIADRTGLSFYVTEKPLDQTEIMDLEPVGGGTAREALNRFTPDMAGKYGDKIVMFGREEKRGYAMIRVIEVEKEHFPELDKEIELGVLQKALWNVSSVPLDKLEEMEAREAVMAVYPDAVFPEDKASWLVSDIVRLMLRQTKAEEQAKTKLDQLMESVTTGGQTFKAAAEERGYRIFSEKGATKRTNVRRPEEPEEPGEGEEKKEFTPEEESDRQLQNFRYFLLKGFSGARGPNMGLIDSTQANNFVPSVLMDAKSDAAFAVYVTAHSMPGPEEMPDIEMTRIRAELMDHNRRSTLRMFFEFDRIVADYDLKVDGLTVNIEETEKPEETPGQ